MKKLLILFLVVFGFSGSVCAQTEPEEIPVENDRFQDYFFEALKQKAITNYDKAITSLQQCLDLRPQNPEVLNEMGKNYLLLKDYKKSYESFEKAAALDPTNRWYLAGMYDVCYQTQDYNQSIVLVKKLIAFDPGYKEDLTSLYMNTGQFDKALDMINELNETVGRSDKRDLYKAEILSDVKYQGAEKAHLIDQIARYPKEESNYISLIYLYSNSNQEEKALEVAKMLEKEIPTSDLAQVSLFKFHLNNNNGDKAVASMKQILESDIVDNKIKHRVINEFLIYTRTNPQYDAELEKAVALFEGDKNIKTSKELGKFHHGRKEWDKAERYYEMDLKTNPGDMETTALLFQVYGEQQKFDALLREANKLIESYPLQPELYYYAGLAYNQLKEFKKAKDVLETGIDYIVDNVELEINFNIQMGEAWHGLGDTKKKESYFIKAENLIKKQKK
jgi:tetratricopeptide (TPR) repeat protein